MHLGEQASLWQSDHDGACMRVSHAYDRTKLTDTPLFRICDWLPLLLCYHILDSLRWWYPGTTPRFTSVGTLHAYTPFLLRKDPHLISRYNGRCFSLFWFLGIRSVGMSQWNIGWFKLRFRLYAEDSNVSALIIPTICYKRFLHDKKNRERKCGILST